MTTQTDPRPGRWILPLVVLGMVAFTYYFVDSLSGDSIDPENVADSSTTTVTTQTGTEETTTTASGEEPTETSSTTSLPLSRDTDLLNYLEDIQTRVQRLNSFQIEMRDINGGFDERPRTVTYQDAETRLTTLNGNLDSWRDDLAQMVVPDTASQTHGLVLEAAVDVTQQADNVLTGLQRPAPDTGEFRRASVTEFNNAIDQLKDAVEDLRDLTLS